MKNDTKIKILVSVVILLITFFNVYFLWSGGGGYIFRFYQTVPNFNSSILYNQLFFWSNLNFSGYPNILGGIFFYLVDAIGAIVQYAINQVAAGIALETFYFGAGGIGMFLLITEFARKYNINAYSYGFLGAIIFTLHPFIIDTFIDNGITLPYVILFLYLILLNLKDTKFYSSNVIGLTLSLGITFYLLGPGSIIPGFIFLLIISLILLSLTKPKKKFLSFLLFALVVAVLMNLTWIVSTYYYQIMNITSQVLNAGAISYISHLNWTIINVMLGFGYINLDPLIAPTPVYPNLVEIFSYCVLFLIAIVPQFIKNNFDEKEKLQSTFVVGLLASFIIFVILSNGFQPPFGRLLFTFMNKIPALLVLRGPFVSTFFVYQFIFSILLVLSLIKLSFFIKRKFNKYASWIFVLSIIFIYFYSVYYLPVKNNNQLIVFNKIQNSTILVSNFINSQKGSFAVAVMPDALGLTLTKNYFGFNLFQQFILHPAYVGGNSAFNSEFAPISETEYSMFAFNLSNRILLANTSISNIMGIFGIHYIIVDNNALNNSQEGYGKICTGCYVTPFNFDYLYKNINFSRDIILLKLYRNKSIYENLNYASLVYGSNIRYLGNASISKLLKIIENKSFNIQNNSIYSTQNLGLFYSNGKLNVSSINGFKQPHIAFIQNSPTKVTVHISNATTPYYLVFRETYDPHWAAFYSNGTMVNQSRHIQVNGFANAWYMDKTGNYTVTLYYTLQTYAWISWAISLAALGVTVSIGVYGWKESKKHSKLKHKPVRA